MPLTKFMLDPTTETGIRLLEEAPDLAHYFESSSPGGHSFEINKYSHEHLHFVGEDGFYPTWAHNVGRWVFQRTLVTVGDMPGAELAVKGVRGADQVIVWVPPLRDTSEGSGSERERLEALGQLSTFPLRCYGKGCTLALVSEKDIVGFGSRTADASPDAWLLLCPWSRLGASRSWPGAETLGGETAPST